MHGVKSFGEVDKYTQNIFPFIQWAFDIICEFYKCYRVANLRTYM